jgi:hypothetical protein
MPERRCHYCQQVFQASVYHPQQRVCCQPECQRRRKGDYHGNKIGPDRAYAETVRNSQSKWRAEHPDYWKQYRKRRPEAVERNREQPRWRDRRRQLGNLAKNNLASAKVFIFQSIVRPPGAAKESCQEQPSGALGTAGSINVAMRSEATTVAIGYRSGR